jgi:predicted GIY-YIG superfamily endonuclease
MTEGARGSERKGRLRLHYGECAEWHALYWCNQRSTGALWQYREGTADGFTRKQGCKMLVWFEQFGDIELAIQRERQMKE